MHTEIVLPQSSKMRIQCITLNTSSHIWNWNETVVNYNTFTDVVSTGTDETLSNGSIQWNFGIEALEQANDTFIRSYSINGSKIINASKYHILTQGTQCTINDL